MNQPTSLLKLHHISKRMSIGSLAAFCIFLMYEAWQENNIYDAPRYISFVDAGLQVSGAAKSPPTILITKGGKKIFFSTCKGLERAICEDKKYWKDVHSVQRVEAVELRHRTGIIQSLIIDTGDENTREIRNDQVNHFITSTYKDPYRTSLIIFVILLLSVALFIISKALTKLYSGKKSNV